MITFQIHLHGKNLESLHKYIPKEALPSQYGGTQSAFDNSQWKSEILNDREYFERLEELHQIGEEEIGSDSSPGEISADGNRIQYIDAETEDSEASEGNSNKFFNCDSPQDDEIPKYLKESPGNAFGRAIIVGKSCATGGCVEKT